MIQVRRNIFETNSSSMHALCIDMSEFWYNEHESYFQSWRKHAKPIHITGGDYGRCPIAPLIELEDKTNYLWTAVVDEYYQLNYHNNEIVCIDKQKIEWWKDKILEELPIGSTFEKITYKNFPWIDHCSELHNFIKRCEENPRYIHTLLSDNSFIEISGDEYPNFISAFLPHNEEEIIQMPGNYAFYIKGN